MRAVNLLKRKVDFALTTVAAGAKAREGNIIESGRIAAALTLFDLQARALDQVFKFFGLGKRLLKKAFGCFNFSGKAGRTRFKRRPFLRSAREIAGEMHETDEFCGLGGLLLTGNGVRQNAERLRDAGMRRAKRRKAAADIISS
jgi:hypothetical protein